MALVHFNMATFFRDGDPGCGPDNWLGDTGSSNPDSFAPSALNVSQWVDSMVAIKVTEAVLTAKHGCGFYLWNTSVQLPRGGGPYPYHVNLERHGDVLAQFVAATSARGIGHGFYYSLTNNFFLNVFGHSARGNSSALPGQYPVSQSEFEALAFDSVSELWTRYGNLTEIWFDGGYSGSMQAELTALLAAAQPNAVCFGGAGITPNTARWCGTESGDPPGWPTIWATAPGAGYSGAGLPPNTPGVQWNPSGVDFTLQVGDHWFFSPGDSLHPLADLVDVYHKSVGCNAKLEVDFAVSRTGQLDPLHVARYAEFGAWMRACYDAPLASGAPGTALTFELPLGGGAPVEVDRVMLREDLRFGQNVNGYLVEYDGGGGAWQLFVNGTTVGNKRIHIREAGAVNATRLRLTLAPGAFPPPYVQTVSFFGAFSPAGCSTAPSPKSAVKFKMGGLCLVSNSTAQFPCGGGADNACPVFLGDCGAATALWVTTDGTFQNLAVATATGKAAGINVDCDSVAPGAVAKLLGFDGGANPLFFEGGQIVYQADAAGNHVLCLDGGGGPYSPPCGSEERSSNQIATQPCSAPSTQGWEMVPN